MHYINESCYYLCRMLKRKIRGLFFLAFLLCMVYLLSFFLLFSMKRKGKKINREQEFQLKRTDPIYWINP